MKIKDVFEGIEEKEKDKILKNLDIETIVFSKNEIILDNSNKENNIYIILKGEANIEKYDYDGNRFIVEKLKDNSIFGSIFSTFSGEIEVIAKEECTVLIFSYNNLIFKNKNKIFINNLMELLTYKINNLNNKIDILSKRTIRDKLIKYLLILSNEKIKKYISLPFTYTDLADYLCVDRSAMMRELKKMKEENIIKINGKKIKLLS